MSGVAVHAGPAHLSVEPDRLSEVVPLRRLDQGGRRLVERPIQPHETLREEGPELPELGLGELLLQDEAVVDLPGDLGGTVALRPDQMAQALSNRVVPSSNRPPT